MPNGTFFYELLAYVSVMWFAAKEDCGPLVEDAKDGEHVEMVPAPNTLELVPRPHDDTATEPGQLERAKTMPAPAYKHAQICHLCL